MKLNLFLKNQKTWMDKSIFTPLPKTPIGRALMCLHNQWDRLISYIDGGEYPFDNNAS